MRRGDREQMTEAAPPDEIVLLAGEREAPHLGLYLQRHNPRVEVRPASTLDALMRVCAVPNPGRRLIAFTTGVIVPAGVLRDLAVPGYNFHPGPPTHPGIYPESFALYEGVTRFGATAHEMTARVDEGPIVGVEWIDVAPGTKRMELAAAAYQATVDLFGRLAPAIVTATRPLPTIGVAWSGTKRRRAEFEAMLEVPPDVTAEELERRWRAFGHGPDNRLHVVLHGRRFVVENDWVDESA